MNWINSHYINKSEVARAMGISVDLLSKKIKKIQRNKLTESNLLEIEKIKNNIHQILNLN